METKLKKHIHEAQTQTDAGRRAWRRAVWQILGNVGLTGLHVWPMQKSWVEFAFFGMPMRHLPQALDGMRIVQVSDLHYSPVVWRKYLGQFVEWINELRPGVVVATGDLYMGGPRYAQGVAKLLSRLKVEHGVVAIMGNHDYGIDAKGGSERGLKKAAYLQQAMEDHGVIMLRNQSWVIHPKHAKGDLRFVGLDDGWAGQLRADEAFADAHEGEAVVCLLHNPAQCLELMKYPWQWMLTGHTHGRQVATGPVGQRLYPDRYRHFTDGLYAINGRYLYVNRGLSYGQRSREWCRPEVTVFTLQGV